MRSSAVRTCTWGESDSNEPASGKLWQRARHPIGKRGRGTAVDLRGCPDTRVKTLGVSTWGEPAGWVHSPRGTPTVGNGQKKGNCQGWACSEEKLEAATGTKPRARREVGPTGKAVLPNTTRICELAGASGLVIAAALTSGSVSARTKETGVGLWGPSSGGEVGLWFSRMARNLPREGEERSTFVKDPGFRV